MSDIKVTLLDSRDEFLPGRSGGPVNAPLLISGIVLVLLGIASVLNPETFLAGLSYASGVFEIVLGGAMCIWPGSLGLIIGLVGIVYGISLIAFSLPIGIDHTNRLW